ncbi:MAG: AmmeMemoRadiSam system protein B [Pseudomonadota bacterium]
MAVYKKMAFAGSWYPVNADECKASISSFLTQKKGPLSGSFLGGIVPHAGWFFSGSIACRVIASLVSSIPVDLVVLFGGHMHPLAQPFVLSHGAVQTPLGDILVPEAIVEDLVNDLVRRLDKKCDILKKTPGQFPDENTLELQYPFIKYFFPEAKIIACCVPPSDAAITIGRAVGELAKGSSKNIKVIGSTDMTHYGPNFGFTPSGIGPKSVEWVKNENDKQAICALIEMEPETIIAQGLDYKNMCCAGAAAATVAACKANGAVSAVKLDYATSYEKSADTSFVGYSGILYSDV